MKNYILYPTINLGKRKKERNNKALPDYFYHNI